MIIWHLKVVEHLNRQDVEPYVSINEGPSDLRVADGWGTKHWEDPGYGRTLELIR